MIKTVLHAHYAGQFFYFCVIMLKKLFALVKNKYLIVTTAFVVWVGIFDQNNLIQQNRLRTELHSIEKERQFYLDEISQDTKTYQEIMTNLDRYEKMAREKYLVKRENEDVYLIVYE